MAQGINDQSLALQLEEVRPDVPVLYQRDKTLFGLIEDKSDGLQTVSTRTYRIPLEILAGGTFQQINPDGGNLGVGSAITTEPGLLNQFYFSFSMQWTKLTEVATESKEKAV